MTPPGPSWAAANLCRETGTWAGICRDIYEAISGASQHKWSVNLTEWCEDLYIRCHQSQIGEVFWVIIGPMNRWICCRFVKYLQVVLQTLNISWLRATRIIIHTHTQKHRHRGIMRTVPWVWSISLTLKSIPTVAIKLPPRKAPSLKRTKTHVFPTDESPSSITCEREQPTTREEEGTNRLLTACTGNRFCNRANVSQPVAYFFFSPTLHCAMSPTVSFHCILCWLGCHRNVTLCQHRRTGRLKMLQPTVAFDHNNRMCNYTSHPSIQQHVKRTLFVIHTHAGVSHSCTNIQGRGQ